MKAYITTPIYAPIGVVMYVIKVNVDAAIAQNNSAIVVVARNDHGVVLKAWSRLLPKRAPIAAKSEAILWALHLVRGENWREIIVESDSKLCIDSTQWAISSVVFDIWLWANSFVSRLFFWVKRSGNAVAHEAAKYTLLSGFSFSSGPSNLPVSVALACKEDAPTMFVSSCL